MRHVNINLRGRSVKAWLILRGFDSTPWLLTPKNKLHMNLQNTSLNLSP